ncbi:MAG: glucoamylase family protein [Ginsengibacter sp.]
MPRSKFHQYPFVTIPFFLAFLIAGFSACKKNPATPAPPPPPPPATTFQIQRQTINSQTFNSSKTVFGVNANPVIEISFSDKVDKNSLTSAISYTDRTNSNSNVAFSISYQNNDSTIIIVPSKAINFLNQYSFSISTLGKSASGNTLSNRSDLIFVTQIDSTDKFPQISDSALLDLVQKQTFKYFWDFGHPVSGMSRERSNGDDETVTTGGSGFGIMAMVAAVNRRFITRSEAVARLNTITGFLITKCHRWHGAFSHWINGSTGATIPFGKNNGADIVETSFLIQGLLTARQYFNSNTDANEIALRDSINSIWNAVDWNWFTQNGNTNSLYWQYNPSYSNTSDIWSIPVTGWNEALITYILAVSSPDHSISKSIYENGWAKNGTIKNGNSYYNIRLPLGPNLGGPLFFAHYSFLGIDPHQLSDQYANYWDQNTAHSKINYQYCVYNPNGFYGYSNACWGLTASDEKNGYSAHSPTNDDGVISPTAAISSLPYTPTESMNALKFFYYKLGDKIWGDYGFKDAFNLSDVWFADSYLAIDQGPQIVMIENYRTGLLWNLFMSCPEVKSGMKNLGFQSPAL